MSRFELKIFAYPTILVFPSLIEILLNPKL